MPDPNEFTEETVSNIIVNPIYSGVGPYPQIVPDAMWIQAAMRYIEENGAEKFLENMLKELKSSFQ